ncbi:MAG: leucine-rich repeat domain-containing protein [Dehalococcoidales bacterium]
MVQVASNGDIFALDEANSMVFKSTNGGLSWVPSLSLGLAAPNKLVDLAISPSYATDHTVFVLSSGSILPAVAPQVYISASGGAIFAVLGGTIGTAGSDIGTCLAVSPSYAAGNGEVMAGTEAGAPAYGNVYIWGKDGTLNWGSQNLIADVTSVAYSPNFLIDSTRLAVGSTAAGPTGGTALHTLVGDDNIGFVPQWDKTLPGSPIPATYIGSVIDNTVLDITGGLAIVKSSIAFPSDFNASSVLARLCFVSIVTNGTGIPPAVPDNVYRIGVGAGTPTAPATGVGIALGAPTWWAAAAGLFQVTDLAYSGTYAAGTLYGACYATLPPPGGPGPMIVWNTAPMAGSTSALQSTWTSSIGGLTGASPSSLALAQDFATSSRIYATTSTEGTIFVSNDGGATFTALPITLPPPVVVTFPDPHLETVIRNAINKPTGDIFQSDLLPLTTLIAYFGNITNLSGLEYCTNLQFLNLQYNQINNINALQNLTNLQTLYLDDNQINDISALQNLTGLQNLYLSNNQITDISALQNLTNLQSLYLDNNQISNIGALQNLTGLQTLVLGSNQINDISPLVTNPGLGSGDYINLQYNSLDTNPGSQAMLDIQALIDRGASVYYLPCVLTINIVGQGSVARDPDKPDYLQGELITLTANPAPGWVFVGWSGDLTGAGSPTGIGMDGSKTITATFKQVVNFPVFVVDNVARNIVDKSEDGGSTWTASAAIPGAVIVDLKISPNYTTDHTVFALSSGNVTTAPQVYISTNGGALFSVLGGTIGPAGSYIGTSLAVSPIYNNGEGEIMVGTVGIAPGFGNVHIWGKDNVEAWKIQNLNEDITSVAYSPNFLLDSTRLAVGSTAAAGTVLHTMVGDDNIAGTPAWDKTIPYALIDSRVLDTNSTGANIISSSIALPSDFNASSILTRICFVSIVANPALAVNNVYRIAVAAGTPLPAETGAGIPMGPPTWFLPPADFSVQSLVYSGTYADGTLFGGLANKDMIVKNTVPMGVSPIGSWSSSIGLTGDGPTYLALTNDFATSSRMYATTSAEGTIFVSNDGGATFTALAITLPPPVVVTFPDPNLEAAIRSAINKQSGDIYASDLLGLTSLDAGSKNITNLSGLEYCSNLQSLYLWGNQISNIGPLQNLTSLTSLRLDSSQITDISALQNLTNLQSLNLWNNQISDISALQNLTNLRELELWNNQISNISALQNLTSLNWLQLGRNQISDISPLQNLTSLTGLILDNNQISDVSALQNLTNLTWIDLSNNRINDINALQNLTSLRDLSLSQNKIADISHLSNLTNLITLDLWSNQISNVSALSDLTNLNNLNLSYNNIIDITALSGLTNLLNLTIDVNQISDISALFVMTNLSYLDLSYNNIIDITVLKELTNLSTLVLYNNKISDITSLANLTSLQGLYLESNQITDISPLVTNLGLGSGDSITLQNNFLDTNPGSQNMLDIQTLINRGANVTYLPQNVKQVVVTFPDHNLEAAIRSAINKPNGDIYASDLLGIISIDAGGKNITNLSGLEYCSNLQSLYLWGNQISNLGPLQNLTSLTSLRLDSSQITDISALQNLTNLQSLNLSNNQINNIDALQHLTNLISLDLGMNKTTDISSLQNLTKLTFLGLYSNQITYIDALQNLTSLQCLYLDTNQINDINGLQNLTGLQNLNLSANQIDNINALHNLTSLTSLYIGGNHIDNIDTLQNLTGLQILWLNGNKITSIDILQNLPNLINLELENNQITDISPLVANPGLGSGDSIELEYNFLDTNPGSQNMVDITTLINRGVSVYYLPQSIQYYNLTINTTGQGTVDRNPDQSNYAQGNLVELTAKPELGWSFAGWSGDLSGTTNPTPITMDSNKTVTATFTRNTFTIKAGAGAHGSISPSGNITVEYSDNQTFTITPDTNYHVADVLADGASVGAVTAYKFSNLTGDHTISASFAINPIVVTSPNGGESWAVGSSHAITWSSAGIAGNVNILLSRDGGTSWAPTPVISNTRNDGTQSWIVTGPATSQARIKVVSVSNPTVFDISDANFNIVQSLTLTSPNGGEIWMAGTNHAITWLSAGITGNVNILVSRDGGISWAPVISNTPNDGTQSWAVTGPATSQARIKVVSVSSPAVFDTSDANFTIVQSITVTSPNGGESWVVGSSHVITWSSAGITGNVNILLSRDGGISWATVISNTPNDGTQSWAVTGPATSQARIKVVSVSNPTVFDISDANFNIVQSLTLTLPNGGESWMAGTNHVITWSSAGITGNVNILISRDGGTSWTPVISNTPNDGTQSWAVTGPATSQARIKIVSVSNPAVFDTSDANFNIVQSITVTSPNGGENWKIGSTQTITWDSTGVSQVRIDISRDGGVTWSTIIPTAQSNGHLSWKVTGLASSHARIRIVALGGSVFDISDADFNIVR